MTEHDGVNDPLNQFRERRREATTITLEDCAICNDSPELHRGGLL